MTESTTSRPGLAARDEAQHLPAGEVVARLRDILGARLVAYIASAADADVLHAWVENEQSPSVDVLNRLRVAFVAASVLREAEGAATVQSWFQGVNPQLEDRAPAQLLRDEPLSEVGRRIEGAAQTAASVG